MLLKHRGKLYCLFPQEAESDSRVMGFPEYEDIDDAVSRFVHSLHSQAIHWRQHQLRYGI